MQGKVPRLFAETEPLFALDLNSPGRNIAAIYDANGNMLTLNDTGRLYTYTYDKASNQLTMQNPLGDSRVWVYNKDSQALTETDYLGRQSVYTYNSLSQLAKIVASEVWTVQCIQCPL